MDLKSARPVCFGGPFIVYNQPLEDIGVGIVYSQPLEDIGVGNVPLG